MDTDLRPARVVSPGRIIQRELEARGWAQRDLADILGRSAKTVNEIIQGHTKITVDTAMQLAQAFGTSPQFWMNLESEYRVRLAEHEQTQNDVARRSRLYTLAPVNEMIKRGWIRPSSSLDELERRVCSFLGINTPDQQPPLAAHFRSRRTAAGAHADEPKTTAATAWVKRVERLATAQAVEPFDPERLRSEIWELLDFAAREEDVDRVPAFFMARGVHFVVVPPLPNMPIDGAAFFCDEHPVIALTLRFDRIDSFWFTLVHELAHIVAGHEGMYLDDLKNNTDLAKDEIEADRLARDWLIPPAALASFLATRRRHISGNDVLSLAHRINRHPGIVVGRLQHDDQVPYRNFRDWLVGVRGYLQPWIDSAGLN